MTIKKTFFSATLLALLLILSTSNINASGLVRIHNYLNTEFSVISIINPSGEIAKLEILDEGNNLIFTKNISKNACSQEIVNFKNSYNGKYTIVVSNTNFKSEDHFELLNDRILQLNNKFNTEEKVFFRIAEKNLFVSRSMTNTNFNLSITDKQGNIIFDEGYVKATTSKKFNISKLPAGKYEVRLYSGKKEFNYVFDK